MSLAVHSLRGPAGRRAVIAAGMTGLLLTGVTAAEGTDTQALQPAPLGVVMPAAKMISVSRYTSALTTGMRLLGQAATAGRTVSYRGVQVISWLTPGGNRTWLGQAPDVTTLDVLHQTGQPPDGVLGLTPTLVDLMRSHYAVMYTGLGSAAGRPASIVEVLRPDGNLAALYWLDNATKLPLRRELFDDRANVISVTGFVGLTVPTQTSNAHASTGQASTSQGASGQGASSMSGAVRQLNTGPAASREDISQDTTRSGVTTPATSAQPWTDRLGSAQLAALRAQGWPVPTDMPGGLTLYDASESATPTGRVVDLAYSDGLSVVSLFVQRGQLPASLAGWRQTDLSGHSLFLRNPAEPDLTWAAGGYVYTVVADAPAPILAGVVDSLPHQARPGFWSRMGRGMKRLLSWANPFR